MTLDKYILIIFAAFMSIIMDAYIYEGLICDIPKFCLNVMEILQLEEHKFNICKDKVSAVFIKYELHLDLKRPESSWVCLPVVLITIQMKGLYYLASPSI